jgi:hypothetical protein
MAESTASNVTPTSNITPSSSNTTIATHIVPSVNTSVVRMTTDAASQVFNTPELPELLLSELEVKGVLLRASLVCRAFKTSIDSSPTIKKILEFAVVDATSTALERLGTRYEYCGSLWMQSVPKRNFCYLVMDFSIRSLELHLSSPSFRKLRLPNLRLTTGTDTIHVNDKIYGYKTLPYVHGESTTTIAEQLEEMIL